MRAGCCAGGGAGGPRALLPGISETLPRAHLTRTESRKKDGPEETDTSRCLYRASLWFYNLTGPLRAQAAAAAAGRTAQEFFSSNPRASPLEHTSPGRKDGKERARGNRPHKIPPGHLTGRLVELRSGSISLTGPLRAQAAAAAAGRTAQEFFSSNPRASPLEHTSPGRKAEKKRARENRPLKTPQGILQGVSWNFALVL